LRFIIIIIMLIIIIIIIITIIINLLLAGCLAVWLTGWPWLGGSKELCLALPLESAFLPQLLDRQPAGKSMRPI
jgi:hypothetical protein